MKKLLILLSIAIGVNAHAGFGDMGKCVVNAVKHTTVNNAASHHLAHNVASPISSFFMTLQEYKERENEAARENIMAILKGFDDASLNAPAMSVGACTVACTLLTNLGCGMGALITGSVNPAIGVTYGAVCAETAPATIGACVQLCVGLTVAATGGAST